jgi:hypothetical protein
MQLSLRPGLRLRPGDLVVLTVIKQLTAGKWAVGIGGRVYPAFSTLMLSPGSVLKARVSSADGRLLLSLSAEPQDPLTAALVREGIPANAESQLIARALILAGLPVRGETIDKVRALMSRLKLPSHKGARLTAALMDKGIDPSSRGIEALMALLSFGERGGGDPRRYRGKPLPTTAKAVKEFAAGLAAAAEADRPDALQAFNHCRGRAQTWVVVPFVFGADDDRLAGTIKVLYDPFLARPLRLALTVEGVAFWLPLEGKSKKLSIFCDDPALRAAVQRGLDRLRAKFHNMGMEVDDTVLGGDAFDGFSPVKEGTSLPIIDVAG